MQSASRKTIVIIVIVVAVLCCLCTALAGGAAALYLFFSQGAAAPALIQELPIPLPGNIPVPEDLPLPENLPVPQVPPAQLPPAAGLGTRQDLMAYYGEAFDFGAPTVTQDMEIVTGTHRSICVKGDCAAVSMAGPADAVTSLAIVVPTDPKDTAQSTVAITLLMNTAMHFAGEDSTLPFDIMTDIFEAQKSNTALDKQSEEDGYLFIESYNPQTHQAGLTVVRAP